MPAFKAASSEVILAHDLTGHKARSDSWRKLRGVRRYKAIKNKETCRGPRGGLSRVFHGHVSNQTTKCKRGNLTTVEVPNGRALFQSPPKANISTSYGRNGQATPDHERS
jgi:hypothetical protein